MEKNPSKTVQPIKIASYLDTVETQDFSKYETKGDILTAYKYFVMDKIVDIREYIQFEDEFEKDDQIPNFFSLHMDVIPEVVMPAIRTSLAFIHEDENIEPILNSLKWDGGRYSSQLHFSTLRKQNIDILIKICDDPIKNLTNFKINTLKEYIEKNHEAFHAAYWKTTIFKVVILMEKIVRTSIQLMDIILQKWPPSSPQLSKVEKKKLGIIKKVVARENSTSLSPRENNGNFLDIPKEMKKSSSKKQVKICPKSFKEIPTIKVAYTKAQPHVKSQRNVPSKIDNRQRSCSRNHTGPNSKTSLTKLNSKTSVTKLNSKTSVTKLNSKTSVTKLNSKTSLNKIESKRSLSKTNNSKKSLPKNASKTSLDEL